MEALDSVSALGLVCWVFFGREVKPVLSEQLFLDLSQWGEGRALDSVRLVPTVKLKVSYFTRTKP